MKPFETVSFLSTVAIGDAEPFFPLLLTFCKFPIYRSKLDEALVRHRESVAEYEKANIERKRFSILEQYGTDAEITDFLNAHLDDSNFRRVAVERAVQLKHYAEAERLALEGIALERSDVYALPWYYQLHDLYKLSGNKKKLADICYILVKNDKTDYYPEWRSLIPEKDFEKELARLLDETRHATYEYIISLENMSDRLYQLCCQFPDKLLRYYETLKTTEYEEPSRLLFEQYLRYRGERVASRSEYVALCKQLRVFASQCGEELAQQIAADFRVQYRRRPAFMTALTQAGF